MLISESTNKKRIVRDAMIFFFQEYPYFIATKPIPSNLIASASSVRSRKSNFTSLIGRKSPIRDIKFPFSCSLQNSHMERCKGSDSRGALIVLEGLDRCGKTSQCGKLVSYLQGLGHLVELWRFPDRNTGVGQMISSYLTNESQLDDRAVHLLFSANRWEKRMLMESKLRSKTTLIVDRYSFSGVAFSSAKGLDLEWCKAPEVGLLAPDLVIYLDISPEKAAERGGYGGERYEQLEFQKKVALKYRILADTTWKSVDATLQIDDVQKQLQGFVMECVLNCLNGNKPLLELWQN